MGFSKVTISYKPVKTWTSAGVIISDGSIARATSIITISNTNSFPVRIDSIKLPVASGKGAVYGWIWDSAQQKNVRKEFNAPGNAVNAKIINGSGTKLFTATVSNTTTVEGKGSTSSSGWFKATSSLIEFSATANKLYIPKNGSVTLGVGVDGGDGSLEGPILSIGNASADFTATKAVCSISSLTISPTSVLAGNSVTASCSYTPTGASVSYQWYDSADKAISGATSATRTPAADDEYCIATVSLSSWTSATKTSSSVTRRTRVTNPAASKLTISGSRNDGRYTNRENYTFSWGAGTNGTNNKVASYDYEVYRGTTKITSGNTTSTSVTVTAADMALEKGDKVSFKIKTKGEHYDASGFVSSSEITVVSAAVVKILVGSTWKDGIVYIKKSDGTWVESTEVKINTGTASSPNWKNSV